MKKISRILVAIASLLIGVIFFTPLWKIDLIAPQYPEGLSVLIWVNKVTGIPKLEIVNDLNHYIGMQPINPDAIPELKWFWIVFLAFLIFGLVVAAVGRKILLYLWFGLYALFGIYALYVFWKWEYEYGHNLDPHAPLQVDPFQPPLVGVLKMMNFTVVAYPHVGGAALILAGLLGAVAVFLEIRNK